MSLEPGETAVGARVAQRLVDARKHRVALFEKARDQTAHEYEEVKEFARGTERICQEERTTTALLGHGLREELARERTPKESALQDLQESLARERTAKEFAAQKERLDTTKIEEKQTLRAVAAPCAVLTSAERRRSAGGECRRRRRRRGTNGGRRHNRGKIRA